MYHKVVTLKLPNKHCHIRLHSIDGRIWCSESPRYAAALQLLYSARRSNEYGRLRVLIGKKVISDPQGKEFNP